MAELKLAPDEVSSTTVKWRARLRELLSSTSRTSKLALVGLGHPLRGDDYVGSFIVKTLMSECRRDGVSFFDAEDGVERVVSQISKLNPKQVVFVDACDMNARAGDIALIPLAETNYPFFTTHGIPLKLLASRFLPESENWLLAIQPDIMEVNGHLSERVNRSAVDISSFISATLEEVGPTHGD